MDIFYLAGGAVAVFLVTLGMAMLIESLAAWKYRRDRAALASAFDGEGRFTIIPRPATPIFQRLDATESSRLKLALQRNAYAGCAVLTSPRDTTFEGDAKEVENQEVIGAIKSCPMHY